jgi:polyphosphate kinase
MAHMTSAASPSPTSAATPKSHAANPSANPAEDAAVNSSVNSAAPAGNGRVSSAARPRKAAVSAPVDRPAGRRKRAPGKEIAAESVEVQESPSAPAPTPVRKRAARKTAAPQKTTAPKPAGPTARKRSAAKKSVAPKTVAKSEEDPATPATRRGTAKKTTATPIEAAAAPATRRKPATRKAAAPKTIAPKSTDVPDSPPASLIDATNNPATTDAALGAEASARASSIELPDALATPDEPVTTTEVVASKDDVTPKPSLATTAPARSTAPLVAAALDTQDRLTSLIKDAEQPQVRRFLDRELSWLAFNERVLELARDTDLPLLERARFLAIFASNLDEFFMVRVAGLKRRIATGLAVRAASGLEPRDLLGRIRSQAHEMQAIHAKVFSAEIAPALADANITIVRWDELGESEQGKLHTFFREQVFPVLTPLAVDPAHPFPYISGLSLNLAVVLRNPVTEKETFARVKVPALLPRLVNVDADEEAAAAPQPGDELRRARFVPLEDIIATHLDQLFPGMEVLEHHTFRVTRQEDLEVEEDDVENLLKALEKELLRRRFGPPVRLEVAEDIGPHMRELLVRELGVSESEVFPLPEPLDLRGLNLVADLDRPEMRYPKFVAATPRQLSEVESSKPTNIFDAIKRRDVLLHHPYDSFSTTVQAFLEQAADDPQVLAIKQTLYRTSGDSPIVDALIDAAEAGKQVLAVVEIKARFDEEANISWARKLERAGVHVVYGIVGLKTHAKLSLVVRQESDGLNRYCHVGTGNYNPKTARLYEDLGMLTCDPQVGEDLSRLFNQLSGYAPKTAYRRLLVAPRSLRTGLVDRIEREIANHEAGRPAGVKIKVNSIVDEVIIDALYRASQAGVDVDVVVRGICAIRPGVPGLSENIRVRSILGRFLEHSRIFWFAGGGEPVVYIGSADMMHRNLDRRVEAMLRLRDPRDIAELHELLTMSMDPETASWHLDGDGVWTRHHHDAEGQPLRDLQSYIIATRPPKRSGRRR